ncbi:MAG: MBL fold metallo-hydrolase [Eubacterium sp.]|nr:MBL fold metallo-hydrolase [Eubacterium sp.]
MQFTFIRNATCLIEYAGIRILVDPMLGEKGSQKPFPNSPGQELMNPLSELPVPVEDLLNPDFVIVTHLHRDHFDKRAAELLPKEVLLLAQNESDAQKIRDWGFHKVDIIGNPELKLPKGISLIRTEAQHSTGEMARLSGPACGVILKHPGEKTLYITGDTVWYPNVSRILHQYEPDVVAVSCGENMVYGGAPLIMGKEGVKQVHLAVPEAVLIACHMESLNHWILSKKELREYALENGFLDHLIIPDDGETISLLREVS